MRIVVDTQLCQGHGVCMGEAPEVFEVTRQGKLTLLQDTPHETLHEQVRLAIRYCPTGALSIVDE